MEFHKNLQVYNKLPGLASDMGIQKRLKCLMVWIQNVYYVKINVFSWYVNEMSIKCLKNICHEILEELSLHRSIMNIIIIHIHMTKAMAEMKREHWAKRWN